MAKQSSKSAPKRKPTDVSASVRIDVSTYARVSAAAAAARIPKSTFMARAIAEAVSGIVVFDRRKSGDKVDLSGDRESTDAA